MNDLHGSSDEGMVLKDSVQKFSMEMLEKIESGEELATFETVKPPTMSLT